MPLASSTSSCNRRWYAVGVYCRTYGHPWKSPQRSFTHWRTCQRWTLYEAPGGRWRIWCLVYYLGSCFFSKIWRCWWEYIPPWFLIICIYHYISILQAEFTDTTPPCWTFPQGDGTQRHKWSWWRSENAARSKTACSTIYPDCKAGSWHHCQFTRLQRRDEIWYVVLSCLLPTSHILISGSLHSRHRYVRCLVSIAACSVVVRSKSDFTSLCPNYQ